MSLAGMVDALRRRDSLEKLTITWWKANTTKKTVQALFNPAELSRSRAIAWEQPSGGMTGLVPDRPRQQFVAVQPETLTLALFFDTYEARADSDNRVVQSLKALRDTANPFATGSASDVRKLTDAVVELGEIDRETHKPPVCKLSWGEYSNIFTGVLTQLDQRFTLFLSDGTPVRATLDCTFTEYRTRARSRAKELHSADVLKTHVVRRGDSLHALAAREYGDPTLWRVIAEANGIRNPLRLMPGTTLTLPRLDGWPS